MLARMGIPLEEYVDRPRACMSWPRTSLSTRRPAAMIHWPARVFRALRPRYCGSVELTWRHHFVARCQQNYTYMRKQYKADALYEKMLHHGSEFGLVNLTYPSFRSVGSYGNTQLPAADLVSAAAAILEAHESTRSATDGSSEGGPSGNAFAAASSAITVGMRDGLDCALRNGDPRPFARCFAHCRAPCRRAMHLISVTSSRVVNANVPSPGVMRNGLERAKELLRATVAVANSVLTARQWANCGDFHSVVLKSGGDTGHFLNPLALTKLALFIAGAHATLVHGREFGMPFGMFSTRPRRILSPRCCLTLRLPPPLLCRRVAGTLPSRRSLKATPPRGPQLGGCDANLHGRCRPRLGSLLACGCAQR